MNWFVFQLVFLPSITAAPRFYTWRLGRADVPRILGVTILLAAVFAT